VVVLLDNHFRASATLAPRPKLGELVAPVEAKRRGLLDPSALELATRAVFTAPVPGVLDDQGTPEDERTVSRRWYVIAPTDRPQVAAPLGWSLSEAARSSLSCQLDARFDARAQGCPQGLPNTDDTQVETLQRMLRDGPRP
jgi:hypothetical protein